MWHTHPTGTARPSGPDLQHFARMHQLLGVSHYVGLILTPRGNGLTATAWITSEGDPLARDPWYRCGPAELTVEGKSWPA